MNECMHPQNISLQKICLSFPTTQTVAFDNDPYVDISDLSGVTCST